MSEYGSALARVLEAAERHARELLQQASVYERNGTQPIADETLNDHYRPLKDAIATLRADDVVVVRREVAEVAEVAVELGEAFAAASSQADICERLARAVRLARALERADALHADAEASLPADADG